MHVAYCLIDELCHFGAPLQSHLAVATRVSVPTLKPRCLRFTLLMSCDYRNAAFVLCLQSDKACDMVVLVQYRWFGLEL